MSRKAWTIWVSFIVVLGVVCGRMVANAGGPPADSQYVGASKCKACHFKAFNRWRKTKHAKVFEQLQGAERTNPDCLRCHTTGYGKPGGYVSEEATPRLKSVGCEACHGLGSAHVDAARNAPEDGQWDKKIDKVPQNACISCHNPHISQKERAMKMRQGGG